VRLSAILRISLPVVLSGLFLVGCGERMYAHYPDRKALEAAGPGARSWFPELLPESAIQLEEWHDVDSNVVIGRFRFSKDELASLRVALERRKRERGYWEVELAMDEVSDWPECLSGRVNEVKIHRCGLEIYPLDGLVVVLDAEGPFAYFWTR